MSDRPTPSAADRIFHGLAHLQATRPWQVLLTLGVLTALSAVFALRLGLRTSWTELLPENQRSILDLRRIEDRMGKLGTFTVLLDSPDLPAMIRFADALTPRLEKELPPDLLRWVDKSILAERRFFEEHKHLYADLDELLSVRDALEDAIREKKAEVAFDLGLDDEEEASPDDTALERARERLRELRRKYDEKRATLDPYPSGYFVSEDQASLAVFVRTAFGGDDLDRTVELEKRVRRMVSELDPASYHPSLNVSYTGNILTARAEHDSVREELLVVSAICISAILASIFLFYWEVRAILALAAGTLSAVLWTFAVTYARIGYLSTATSFLSSIVPGNGINSGLILIARYLEERRAGRTPEHSIARAMSSTWAATLTAALAASFSYAALLLTDFRGFNQFGFIGGVGLLLCWVGNYLIVPPLLVLTSRKDTRARETRSRRGFYGRPFAWLGRRIPRTSVLVGTALALVGSLVGLDWLRSDPFEYDFRKLRNERSTETGAGKLQSRVEEILKSRPRDGMAITIDRPDQLAPLVRELERIRDEHDPAEGPPPVGDIQSLQDLVPADQPRKIEVLEEIRSLALQVLPRLPADERADVEGFLPPEHLEPITVADVPVSLRRPFTERDGTVGLILYVAPPSGVSVWDGRGLIRFADAVRAIQLPNGEVVHSSGSSVIFADLLTGILTDGPRLTLASLAAVLLLVAFTFRRLLPTGVILFSLLIGIGWMLGLTAFWGMRLNFLNFIAIPITFGIGVDYSVNVVRRYLEEGWERTRHVLIETGGAVILCSLTTIWGYLSLLYSDNQALRSFGKLAVLGELTCLAASVLVLPGLATLVARRMHVQPRLQAAARHPRPERPLP